MLSASELDYDSGARAAEKLFMQGAKMLHDTRTDRIVMWLGPQNQRQVHHIYPFKVCDIHRWMSRHPGYRCRYSLQGGVRIYWVDLAAEACYTTLRKGGEHGYRRERDIDAAVASA